MSGASSDRIHFRGMPVYVTNDAPTMRLKTKGRGRKQEHTRVPVVFTVTEHSECNRVIVHPDRWDEFVELVKAENGA